MATRSCELVAIGSKVFKHAPSVQVVFHKTGNASFKSPCIDSIDMSKYEAAKKVLFIEEDGSVWISTKNGNGWDEPRIIG